MLQTEDIIKLLDKADLYANECHKQDYSHVSALTQISMQIMEESTEYGINEQDLDAKYRKILDWVRIYAFVSTRPNNLKK